MTFQDLFDLMSNWSSHDPRWDVELEDDCGCPLNAVKNDGTLVFEPLDDDETDDWGNDGPDDDLE